MTLFLQYLFLRIQIEKQYKLSFVFELLNIGLTLVLFFYISRMVNTQFLEGNYFKFVTFGLFIGKCFQLLSTSFLLILKTMIEQNHSLVLYQLPYRLEKNLLILSFAQISLPLIKLFSFVVIFLLIFPISIKNFPLLIYALTLLLSYSLIVNFISASSYLLWKKFNPMNFFSSFAYSLISGVYFPIDYFPSWLKAINQFNPLTIILKYFRSSFSLSQNNVLDTSSFVLIFFSFIFCFISWQFLKRSLFLAQTKGYFDFF